jgi:hypothetical protein
MSLEFLKADSITLNGAGYLVSKVSEKPVTHSEFVRQQKNAEYIIKLAAAIDGKIFVANKVDNLAAIKKEVFNSINSNATVSYVDTPVKPTNDIQDQLTKFALEFVDYQDSKEEASKINKFMQEFNKINDVESVGEYFTEGLTKLSKIYTINEILAAVKINVEKLGSI